MTDKRYVKIAIFVLLAILPLSAYGQDFAAPPDNSPQPLAAPYGYPPADMPPQPLADPSGYAQPAYMPAPESPQPLASPQAAPPGSYQPQPAQPVTYTQQQIDQMLAPIALYPDLLISQILMASTYPLEIVEAQRWRQNPQNAQLAGDQLQAALDQQPWDPSVKSLVAFPQVLNMLDNNIQWTEQLGDAFLASQGTVMDSIQRLRQLARNSGNLNSTPQQTVAQQQGEILIQPAQPQMVYVPYYNPTVVYGAWPYPAYEPYYFPPPPGVVFFGALGFGVGLAIVDGLWGWNHWDWHDHRIIVDDRRYVALNHGVPPRFTGDVWAHDVAHRHGVPYRTAEVRAQYQGNANDARRGYRGYFNQTAVHANTNVAAPAGNTNFARANTATPATAAGRGLPLNSHFIDRPSAPNTPTVPAPAMERPIERPQAISGFVRSQAPAMPVQAQTARPAQTQQFHTQTRTAPMFESFSRGPEVRTQAERGSASRASMPTPHTEHTAPAAAHGGGGHEGSGHNESGRQR